MKAYSVQQRGYGLRASVRVGGLLCLVLPAITLAGKIDQTGRATAAGPKATANEAKAVFPRQHLADYDAELRGDNGRVDVERMAHRLKELGVTTYYWLIWHAPTDWEDLKLFLPRAAEAVTYCLDKSPRSLTFPSAQKLFSRFRAR